MKACHTTPAAVTELMTILADVWQVMPEEHFRKLVETMPSRVEAVIKDRGGPTRC